MTADLFSSFDSAEVAAIERHLAKQKEVAGKARAQRLANKHHMRRAKAEETLGELLPARIAEGDSYHVISHGDIDSLSYLRHCLSGAGHFDHVMVSTWCIAKNDLQEIEGWLDTGRIEQFDLYAGEIFPGSYGDEYEHMLKLCEAYGCRLVIAKNHSKIMLCYQAESDYHLVIESSANVNTNPRIEQSTVTCSRDLHAFYLEFFNGLKSIDKHSQTH